jgi:ABC-type thiamin/hydroxymethylpyrimidine transport system permease subunit
MVILHYINLVIITISTINVSLNIFVFFNERGAATKHCYKTKKATLFQNSVAFGIWCLLFKQMVGDEGLEPPTPSV